MAVVKEWDEYNNYSDIIIAGEREREDGEWIECDGDMLTVGTCDGRFKEPVHQINNHRIVARFVIRPLLVGILGKRLIGSHRLEFHIGLFEDSVQVFVLGRKDGMKDR